MNTRIAFILKISLVLVAAAFFAGTEAYAGIKFSEADINGNDEVLFTVCHNIAGTTSYKTLFSAKIKDGTAQERPQILTAFPEKMELLGGGSILQIRNRYGTAFYHLEENRFEWKKNRIRIPENSVRLSPSAVSPDGKWYCNVEKTGVATGRLELRSSENDKIVVLDTDASFSYQKVPVKWIGDSSAGIYEKNGNVYFFRPDAMMRGVEVAEEYRKIGPGSIESVNWAGGKYLVYIDSDLVYRINSKELYTLGLYSGIIGKGTAIGRLPFQFSAFKDKFSVSPDLGRMVLIQAGKVITSYRLDGVTSDYLDVECSRPFFEKNASLLETSVLWCGDGYPLVWMKTLPFSGEKPQSSVYKITDKFSKLLVAGDSDLPYVSNDGKKCAFYSGTTLYVYDVSVWKRIAELGGERTVCVTWIDSDNLYVGGEKTIRRWTLSKNSFKTIMLSSAVSAHWNEELGVPVADAGNGHAYNFDKSTSTWSDAGSWVSHSPVINNGRYRLFCGETKNPGFENALYVRTLSGKAVTKPVLSESTEKRDALKQCALVFDAYDNADGLSNILYQLSIYNIRGTFFLNGEFIRRYPNETKQIASTSNECAAMFFTTAKLSSKEFVVNEDFIRRGLARNEDEFYQATDKELSLLWHAPSYQASENVVQSGANAGYTYVNALEHTTDTITLEQTAQGINYYTTSKIIERYIDALKANNGGILPVTVGISRGTRERYLYEDLDLLIAAILDEGFEIVPVRTLLK